MSKKVAEADTWTEQLIGESLTNNAVEVPDQHNIYIARCEKEGAIYFGKAWKTNDRIQCEFALGENKLTSEDIKDKIQILTYDGNHMTKGFFYEWVKFGRWLRHASDQFRVPLRCGPSNGVILWPQKSVVGTLNIDKKTATFVSEGQIISLTESELYDFFVLVRNTRDYPPHCTCEDCEKRNMLEKETSPSQPLRVNEWGDYRTGAPFPTKRRLIKALNRPLNTLDGPQEQYVALWYHFGQAVMGRAWNENGKIAAAFVCRKTPFLSNVVSSLQLLVQIPGSIGGFDYSWQPYSEAAKIGVKEWNPVHIGFTAPCVLTVDKEGHEYLGAADLKEESATTVLKNEVFWAEGKAIFDFKVLCRRDRDDTQAI